MSHQHSHTHTHTHTNINSAQPDTLSYWLDTCTLPKPNQTLNADTCSSGCKSGLCKKSSDSCLGVSRLRFCFASLPFYLPLCFMWTDLQEFDGGVNHKAPRNVKGLHSSRDAYMLVYTRRKQADSGNSYLCSGFWRAACHLTTRIIIDCCDKMFAVGKC